MHVSARLFEELDAALREIHAGVRVYVAYSGGLDSQCLLHLASGWAREQRVDLMALHVNHGLSPNADFWQTFCMQQCQQLEVALICKAVNINATAPGNTEQWARNARYAWFETQLRSDDIVLMAHHQQDQAETLLLRMLRASGTRGLAAIPSSRTLGKGRVLRPFLRQSKDDLHAYAEQHNLQWVEDESNMSLEFDRNYIRHKVMPSLVRRWPQAPVLLSRTARHCGDEQQLLNELAEIDLQATQIHIVISYPSVLPALDLVKFMALSLGRQRNLLQFMLKPLLNYPVPAAKMKEWLRQVNSAPLSDSCSVQLDSIQMVLYDDKIHFIQCGTPASPTEAVIWKTDAPLSIPDTPYTLSVIQRPDTQLKTIKTLAFEPGEAVCVHWRQGGERVQLQANGFSRSLKKLLQATRIPPWMRSSMPLISIEGYIVWSAALGDFVPGLLGKNGNQYSFALTLCAENKFKC